MFICPCWLHSVVCRGQWPLSAEPGCSFRSPFPPSQAGFLSEPAPHVRGCSPAGRVGSLPHDCFCFYGTLGWGQPGVGLNYYSPWRGLEPKPRPPAHKSVWKSDDTWQTMLHSRAVLKRNVPLCMPACSAHNLIGDCRTRDHSLGTALTRALRPHLAGRQPWILHRQI